MSQPPAPAGPARLLSAAALLAYLLASARVGASGGPLLGGGEVAFVSRAHAALGDAGRVIFAPIVPAATLVGALILVATAALARGEHRRALAIVVAMLAVRGVSSATKQLTDLPRPYVALAIAPPRTEPPLESFPSGHAALAGIAAATLPRSRRGLAIGVAILAYVTTSRVVLAFHHPSDVLAGAALGVVLGLIVPLSI